MNSEQIKKGTAWRTALSTVAIISGLSGCASKSTETLLQNYQKIIKDNLNLIFG